MRKAINGNPIVQIGLLAGLAVLVAVVFMSQMGGGSSTAPEEPATADSAAAASSTAPATGAPAPDAAVPAEPAAVTPEAVPSSAPTGDAPFAASKGLPAEVVSSHESGDVVVLLVMQGKGIEDEQLRSDVETLESDGSTSVFVTDVKNVAKYSRIAEGVNLDRIPAIIVLHPLDGKLAKGQEAPLPQASVAYGYRGPESVRQTVEDVLYEGKQLAYDPG